MDSSSFNQFSVAIQIWKATEIKLYPLCLYCLMKSGVPYTLPYVCSRCPQTFVQKKPLLNHERKHLQQDEVNIFTSKASLQLPPVLIKYIPF